MSKPLPAPPNPKMVSLDPLKRRLSTLRSAARISLYRRRLPRMSSAIAVGLATPADVPAMADVMASAVRSNPLRVVLHSLELESSYVQAGHELFQLGLEYDVSRSDGSLLVARDIYSGQVVGLCGFFTDSAKPEPRIRGFLPFKDATNQRLFGVYDQLDTVHYRHVDEPHMVCTYLFVSPQYQHKGVARQLIQYALGPMRYYKRTLYANVPIAARKLFMDSGWREVDTLDIDLVPWAGDHSGYGSYRFCILVRDPETRGDTESESPE